MAAPDRVAGNSHRLSVQVRLQPHINRVVFAHYSPLSGYTRGKGGIRNCFLMSSNEGPFCIPQNALMRPYTPPWKNPKRVHIITKKTLIDSVTNGALDSLEKKETVFHTGFR